MLTYRRFRYRFYPTPKQESRLRQWEGAQRTVWNLANEQRAMGLQRLRGQKRIPTAQDQMKELRELREQYDWISDVPRNLQAKLLIQLDEGWQRFFLKLNQRAPRFKKRGQPVMLCEPDGRRFRVAPTAIKFPKLGWLEARVHRPIAGIRKSCSLVRDADQWFACIVCKIEVPDPKPRPEPRIGIDVGVANLATDSDGKRTPNPQQLAKSAQQLARAQRALARKKKGSRNREKAKLRVARIHRKLRGQRHHFLHVLSHRYAKSHGTVVVEALQVRNMTRSASGTKEAPGRNVAAKRGLNRNILDCGWGRFRELLRYKLAWSGGQLVEVPAQYSSQTCAQCGHVDAASRVTQAQFKCTKCGHEDHADVNAAKVLLSRGSHGGAVCGGSAAVRRPMKQKLRVVRRGSRKGKPCA